MTPKPASPSSNGAKERVHILVVEDEVTFQKLLSTSLERQGHTVTVAGTGAEALALLREKQIDLVLLDILLPDMNGFNICQELRTFSRVPVVMLTALNRTDDIVHGFNVGADDYITKPFRIREVQVRIQAILRRLRWHHSQLPGEMIRGGGISINERTQEVLVRGKNVHLTPIEYRLMRYLMERPNRPISKGELFQEVWGYNLTGGTNLVEVAIRRLRSKIEESPSQPKLIVTVHAVGYKFVCESSAPAGG